MDPMTSMAPMSMPPRTGPLDPMASMPPGTTPLVDPMASIPPMTTPNPYASMPTPNPYASMPTPNPMASMPPSMGSMPLSAPMAPGTTPLVDPAGPLPSEVFTSAAAVPTQLYSAGTFPASGTGPPDGFASAASVPGSPTKPSLWTSASAGAAGPMQSAPAPAKSTPIPAANPFATSVAEAPPPMTAPPATAAAADTVGNGDVTLRVSRLLDIPKDGPSSGSYYVEISTKDGKRAEIGPFEASPTGEITEDVDVKSAEGDLTVTTKSPEIIVKVSRAGGFMYGKKLIGEASIHRLDPRSRGVCAYALSSRATPHPGGIELVVLERPPGKAAAHEPEGLLPAQHHVMAILDIEKLVMLPPVSGMQRDEVEIRIEPLEKMSAGHKQDLSHVLGPYPTKPDPTKPALRMVDARERVEYKGMFRADKGGLKRVRIS